MHTVIGQRTAVQVTYYGSKVNLVYWGILLEAVYKETSLQHFLVYYQKKMSMNK
jgi:hypothetical protein